MRQYLLGLAAATLLVAMVLRQRFVIITVHGDSMMPALLPGDRVLVRRIHISRLRRGQVAVVEMPGAGGWSTPRRGPAGRCKWMIKGSRRTRGCRTPGLHARGCGSARTAGIRGQAQLRVRCGGARTAARSPPTRCLLPQPGTTRSARWSSPRSPRARPWPLSPRTPAGPRLHTLVRTGRQRHSPRAQKARPGFPHTTVTKETVTGVPRVTRFQPEPGPG